jgi:anti-sigma regulatory factor (Ser/Thr protein kinase)
MNADGVVSAFRVPASQQSLAFVRSATACVLARSGWPAADVGRILLACGEAVQNAIEHGSPAGGEVRVELVVTARCARLRVIDQGVGGPPPVCPAEPPPHCEPRGRGLLIMDGLAEKLAIRSNGRGTVVAMRFERVRPRSPARAAARRAA